MASPFFSIIVPVYNRPDELKELIYSLTQQTFSDFELVVIEDGSTDKADQVVNAYASEIAIQYEFKENAGPAIARNRGMELARGNYFLFIDSDCIAPEDWLELLAEALGEQPVDAFGGPDLAAPDFNLLQKAISFAMTSFFTTGGIRGGKKQVDKFHPRSFNMGIRREIFETIGGFPVTRMHPGEDMVFTLEIIRRGYSTALFPDAGVYHKRRNTLRSFYRQVFRFGRTRYVISRIYPETRRWVFWMPSLMVLAGLLLLLFSWFLPWLLLIPGAYFLLIFVAAALPTNCTQLGLLAMLTSAIQIVAYGLGFLQSVLEIKILRRDVYGVLKSGFYPE